VELPEGRAVTLTWKPDATHLFDAATGTRYVWDLLLGGPSGSLQTPPTRVPITP
jgi:hypothetical protein